MMPAGKAQVRYRTLHREIIGECVFNLQCAVPYFGRFAVRSSLRNATIVIEGPSKDTAVLPSCQLPQVRQQRGWEVYWPVTSLANSSVASHQAVTQSGPNF